MSVPAGKSGKGVTVRARRINVGNDICTYIRNLARTESSASDPIRVSSASRQDFRRGRVRRRSSVFHEPLARKEHRREEVSLSLSFSVSLLH